MTMPNGSTITSVATGNLHLSTDLAPIKAHIFDNNDLNRTLIAVADICDTGCETTLTNTGITITRNGVTVLHASKDKADRLWPLLPPGLQTTPKRQSAHNIVRHQHNADFVAYAHASFCSPSVESLEKALRAGYLGNFPRLTAKMLSDNPPVSMATAKGHLNRNRQSQRHRVALPPCTTRTREPSLLTEVDDDHNGEGSGPVVLSKVMNLSQWNNSDLTGKVPVCSITGNNYILVSVFNSYIHLEPMASREGAQYVAATQRTVEFFRDLQHDVAFQRMDNETSKALERYMRQEKIEIQFVPPHNHRANPAERAIQTTKNHLIAALCGTHENFPARLWDTLLPQVELTMNILRPFGADRTISAYEGIFRRKFDFEAHPIAPCGTLVLVHEPPEKRASFASHGTQGFYLGPALQHHRSYRVFVMATQAERVSDSLAWFPAPLLLPGSTTTELVCDALRELTAALRACATEQPGTDLAVLDELTNKATVILQSAGEALNVPQESAVALPITVDPQPVAAGQQRVEEQVTPPKSPVIATMDDRTSAPEVAVRPGPGRGESAQPTHTVEAGTLQQIHQRPRRSKNRPERFRHVYHIAETSDMAFRELEEAIQGDERADAKPAPHQQEHCVEFMSVDLKAICAPITYKETRNGPDRVEWRAAESREIIRLVEESGTMRFIHKHEKPRDRLDSYANPQPSIKIKEGIAVRRMRMVYGGNRSDYTGPLAAQTAELSTIKCLFNAAISEPSARLATADIKDFYLGTVLDRPEYMRITRDQLPTDIVARYGLETYMNKGASGKRSHDWVMVEIVKGIYGLPQAGRLAQEKLVKHLAKHGYTASDDTSCLFSHVSRPSKFTLVVDDFAIKYNSDADLDHLLDALREDYVITVDREIKKYVGMTVVFDREANTVSLSMPDYVMKALRRFNVVIAGRATDSPLLYTPPSYGKSKQQYAPIDMSRKLNATEINRLQQIIGVFLYYARAVDPTMLTALSKFGSLQSRGTQNLQEAVGRFLQYAAHWPVAVLVYHASDMRLMVESDASYLSEPEARSRAGGLHYLGNYSPSAGTNRVNGAVECMSTIIKSVVSSAFEAEYAALYLNGQTAQALRNTLRDLGYPQQATPFISDNACAVGVANRTVKQRRSKAIDMRFHWLRDRVKIGDFTVKWEPGKDNLADYFTKAHPVHHYKAMRSTYVQ